MSGRFVSQQIELLTSIGPVSVEAECHGALAAHRLPGVELLSGQPAFGITLVSNGLSLSGGMGFDTLEQAKNAARCLAAFPVDWAAPDLGTVPHLRDATWDVMALCGAFIIQNVMDGPAGGRA